MFAHDLTSDQSLRKTSSYPAADVGLGLACEPKDVGAEQRDIVTHVV